MYIMHSHTNAVYDVHYFISIPQIEHSTFHLIKELISGRGSMQIYYWIPTVRLSKKEGSLSE